MSCSGPQLVRSRSEGLGTRLVQSRRNQLEVIWEEVGVCVEREHRGGVAEHRLDGFHIGASANRQRSARMPEIVRCHDREFDGIVVLTLLAPVDEALDGRREYPPSPQ